jgi:hypothetical protein
MRFLTTAPAQQPHVADAALRLQDRTDFDRWNRPDRGPDLSRRRS